MPRGKANHAQVNKSLSAPAASHPATLDHAFYARPALVVARELIGKIVIRRINRMEFRARIVETEAYVGTHDLASHASKGRTTRTEVMFAAAGRAYVYLIYGMHNMFNIVTGDIDDPQAVLIRAAEPMNGWVVDLSGPGKFCRALQITLGDNGRELTRPELCLIDEHSRDVPIVATPRIGVDYAGDWKDALLRFVDPFSAALSSRKGLPVSSPSR